MSDPFLGEVRIFGFNFPPKNWALCNGQIMAIAQNQALFALLGTSYGGNGQQTFALPDLRGRVPIHYNANFPIGSVGGEENHTLIINEMPAHIHQVQGDSGQANTGTPANDTWAAQDAMPFSPTANGTMNPAAIAVNGSSQPHPNLPPYLTVNFCIALAGIFPSRP